MRMPKDVFMVHVRALYRCANLSDSDHPDRADWTKPEMAGTACCVHLDQMLWDMEACGAITSEDIEKLHATL